MVKDKIAPLQPLAVGVTAIVLTPAAIVANEAILPVPLAANPIDVLLLIHE